MTMNFNTNPVKMTLAIRRLRRVLDAGDAIRREAEKAIAEINADKDHSDAWKTTQRDKINTTAQGEYKDLGAIAGELVEQMVQIRRDFESGFDFTAPDWTAALTTIQAVGKALPPAAQQKIVEQFAGNPVALKALKPTFVANAWSVAAIDEQLDVFNTLEESLFYDVRYCVTLATDPLGKVQPKWETGSARRTLTRFEKSLRLDTEANAWQRELERYADDPSVPSFKRARAQRFLKNYAEELANDDPDILAKAEKRLSEDFAVPSDK